MVIDNAYECLIFSHCGGCKGTAKSPQCPCVHLPFPGLSCMYIYKETMDRYSYSDVHGKFRREQETLCSALSLSYNLGIFFDTCFFIDKVS